MSKYEVYVESYARFIVEADSKEEAEEEYRNLSTEYISSILYDNITSPRIQPDEF